MTSQALTATSPGRTGAVCPARELRCLLEAASLLWAFPWLLSAPRGDGHPVVVVPGFLGGDSAMWCHLRFLANRGYDVSHWGLGRNIGFHPRHAMALEAKIRYLHHLTGRKVSLVGWSLGGVFALSAAQSAPECVRQIITLGSPINVERHGSAGVPSFMNALYRVIAHPMGFKVHFMRPKAKALRQADALPMPISCLYGVRDAIVPTDEAVLPTLHGCHENIRVPASHLGMVVNPLVLWIVADRLALPEGTWSPFKPTGASGLLYRALTPELAQN